MKTSKMVFSLIISVMLMVCLFSGVVEGSEVDPSTDLTEALLYWQEQALLLRQEIVLLRTENERLSTENKALRLTLNDAEALMLSLRVDLEKMNSLRLQAETSLSIAIAEIEQLELTIKKLSGARFGLIFGAVYNGSFGGLAGVTVSF